MKMNLFGGTSLNGLLLSLAVLIPNHADAGLIGPGTTVQAFYYNGVFASPEGQDWVDSLGNITSLPAPLTAPVDFLQGAASGSTTHVGDIQIVITNDLSGLPFCTTLNIAGPRALTRSTGSTLSLPVKTSLACRSTPARPLTFSQSPARSRATLTWVCNCSATTRSKSMSRANFRPLTISSSSTFRSRPPASPAPSRGLDCRA